MSNQLLKNEPDNFDAIIVGASISGCICALALAKKNWRVAILEKRREADHYKKICTHIIHPSGVKVLQSLDLYETLQQSSAQATCMQLNFGHRALYYPFGGRREAANIERKDLDPVLRKATSEHPNITLFAGCKLQSVSSTNNSVSVCASNDEDPSSPLRLSASLLIGADGRQGTTALLAGGEVSADKNRRVAVFAYFEHPDPAENLQEGESRIWAFDQGAEYVGYFPNQTHILVSWYLAEDEYQKLKNTLKRPFDRALQKLEQQGLKLGPIAESPAVAKRTAPVKGRVSLPRVCLIGDAKLAADPLTGVGCSWAMSSANLLAKQLPSRSHNSHTPISPIKIRFALMRYRLLHPLMFSLPSSIMTFVSLHGRWIYNRPVFRTLSWLTGKRPS